MPVRLLAAVLVAVLAAPAGALSMRVGRVVKIVGEAKVNGKKALTGQRVLYGDSVEADPQSVVDVEWASGDVSRLLGPAKILHLKQIANAPHLLLESGRLVSRTKHFTRYRVLTATGEVSGDGADYFVDAVSPLRTYVCRRRGEVFLETRREQDDGLAMRLSGRRAVAFRAAEIFVPSDEKPPEFLPAAFLYHLETDYDGL